MLQNGTTHKRTKKNVYCNTRGLVEQGVLGIVIGVVIGSGFLKVKWLHLTGEVGKSVRSSCQIFSGFNIPKLLKSVNFLQSYSKNKKLEVFWGAQGNRAKNYNLSCFKVSVGR